MIGTLDWTPVLERIDLVAPRVAEALGTWPHTSEVRVAQIDPTLADTAALAEAHGVPLDVSANCVVVAGKRGGEQRVAACLVLASTRADVNGLVRRTLEVRKASFLPMDDAVERTSMEYGGITPFGLPEEWTLLVDAAVVARPFVVVGSGVRRSKLALPGQLVGGLPGARVLEGLGVPVDASR